ncbi:MAG: Uma2 family endonuclease [Chloroflexota bacterium]|nr:Uma2 family endonuclease [Chloroflexota bacterium]
MSTTRRFTSADLERLPDVEGTRYEIIDGELHVSKQPRWEHQYACSQAIVALQTWSNQTGLGLTLVAPGVIFSEDNDVAPDVVWISRERLAVLRDAAGHLRGAPELVVEVLSPGAANERRDREAKLRLYSRQGVDEYWILDWRTRTVELFRREDGTLRLVATLTSGDTLASPLLPGFACAVSTLWPPSEL